MTQTAINECVACLTREAPLISIQPFGVTHEIWFKKCICAECGSLYLEALELVPVDYDLDDEQLIT